jgi:PAS domain S-box-containing protein
MSFGGRSAPGDTEQRFRAIFDAAPIGIALADLDGYIVESNRALQQLLGYSAEEFQTVALPTITQSDDPSADLRLVRELVAGQRDAYQIDRRFLRKDGGVIWGRLTVSLVRTDIAAPRYAIQMIEDITEHRRSLARRDALLRLAHTFAEETAPNKLMQTLLSEAVGLTDASFGIIATWDERDQLLHPVWNTVPLVQGAVEIRLGDGAGGKAAARHESVVMNDYQLDAGALPTAREALVQAAMAIPLLHGARLLGVVTVTSNTPGRRFGPEDEAVLQVLAGLGSAVLVGIERARLEGALLASRTAQHAINNQLGAVVGYAELVMADAQLPDTLRTLVDEIRTAADAAAIALRRLGAITRLEEVQQGGPWPVLDLSRSTPEPDAQ